MKFSKCFLIFLFLKSTFPFGLIAKTLENTSSFVYYQSGNALEKFSTNEQDYSILNIGMPIIEEEIIIQEIMNENPDVVCLSGVFKEETAYILFQQLKNIYSHFYITEQGLDLSENKFLIASKYSLNDVKYTPEKCETFASIHFLIKNGSNCIGHVQQTNLRAPFSSKEILKHIHVKPLFINHNPTPSLLSQKIKFPKKFKSENSLLDLNSTKESSFILLTIVKSKTCLSSQTPELNEASYLLCKQNQDKESYVEYDISASQDSNGNASAKGGLDYTQESKDGSRFSVGIEGEVKRDKNGDTNASVEVRAKGRF